MNSRQEIENKQEFVKELGELFKKYNVEYVSEMKYIKKEDDEIVEIYFEDILGDKWVEKVNVHMDSLAAIVRDIMKVMY